MKPGPKKSLSPGTRLVGVNLEPELRGRLRVLARAKGLTMSDIVRLAVDQYLAERILTKGGQS